MLLVAPFKMENREVQRQGNQVKGGNDSEGQHMNRNATKVSDYGPFSVPGPEQRGVCCVLMMAGGD